MASLLPNIRIGWIAGVIAGTLALISCGGGGGSSSGSGGANLSTVQGNVVSVVASSSFQQQPGAQALLAALLDAIASPAYAQAGVSGLTVSIAGQSAVTDGGGNFIVTGVPAGDQTLTINFGTGTASTVISIPPNTVVVVANIVVNGGNAMPGNVAVTPVGGGNDNSAGNDNTGAGNTNTGNDNTGGNTNDDDSSDGNDNAGGNANDDDSSDNDDDSDDNSGPGGGNSNT